MKFMNYFKVVNQVFKGHIKLFCSLFDCYCLLQVFFDSIKYLKRYPTQIVIRIKNKFTCLIFTSGHIRFMGNCDLGSCNEFLNYIDFIHTSVITPLHKVSETICINTKRSINLFDFVSKHCCSSLVKFEPEIFPAVSLHFWSPIHVNVFHTGKIIVLGKDASLFVPQIIDYINKTI